MHLQPGHGHVNRYLTILEAIDLVDKPEVGLRCQPYAEVLARRADRRRMQTPIPNTKVASKPEDGSGATSIS